MLSARTPLGGNTCVFGDALTRVKLPRWTKLVRGTTTCRGSGTASAISLVAALRDN